MESTVIMAVAFALVVYILFQRKLDDPLIISQLKFRVEQKADVLERGDWLSECNEHRMIVQGLQLVISNLHGVALSEEDQTHAKRALMRASSPYFLERLGLHVGGREGAKTYDSLMRVAKSLE